MELRISLRKIGLLSLLLLASASAPAADPVPSDSLYQLTGDWQTAEGKSTTLAEELRGGPVVVTMAYTRCTYTCPLIVKKLKEIDASLGHNPKLRFLILSFDTKKETPQSMQAFMKEKGIESGRWKMAKGKSPAVVREIAALLEVSYKEDAKGEFSHSNVITLLDSEGRIVKSIKGIAADHAPLLQAAKNSL